MREMYGKRSRGDNTGTLLTIRGTGTCSALVGVLCEVSTLEGYWKIAHDRPHRLEAGVMEKKKTKDESKEREEGGMRWERKMDKRKRNSILEGSFEM